MLHVSIKGIFQHDDSRRLPASILMILSEHDSPVTWNAALPQHRAHTPGQACQASPAVSPWILQTPARADTSAIVKEHDVAPSKGLHIDVNL